MDETVVRHSPYVPKPLAKYARKVKMEPKEALIFALANSPSNAEAARKMGISRATMTRWVRDWQIRIDR